MDTTPDVPPGINVTLENVVEVRAEASKLVHDGVRAMRRRAPVAVRTRRSSPLTPLVSATADALVAATTATDGVAAAAVVPENTTTFFVEVSSMISTTC